MNTSLPKELHGRKASDVFLEFADDYIKAYIKDTGNVMPQDQKIKEILQVPWMIWNAYAFAGSSNVSYLGSLKLIFKQFPSEIKRYLDDMIEKRKTIYSKYKYGLREYKIKTHPETGEINLSVESVMPRTEPIN